MMRLQDLFHFPEGMPSRCDRAEVSVAVNDGHDIFKGHFPERPILPGVCMVHLMQRILQSMHGGPLVMDSARSIKFLAPVDPGVAHILLCKLELQREDGIVKSEGSIMAGDIVVMKMTARSRPGGN